MVIKQNTSSFLAFQHPQQFFESRTFVSLDIDAMTVLGKVSQPADCGAVKWAQIWVLVTHLAHI